MNKAKALKIGKAGGAMAWVGAKFLVRLLFIVIVFLATWWFKLLITAALGGYSSAEEEAEESEYWWYINHSDPMHLHDEDDRWVAGLLR